MYEKVVALLRRGINSKISVFSHHIGNHLREQLYAVLVRFWEMSLMHTISVDT